MAIRVEFDGNTYDVTDDVIDSISFKVDSPLDVDSKAAISRICLVIRGKIINTSDEKTVNFARWAASASRVGFQTKKFTVSCMNKDKTVRQYELNQAFVVDYKEKYEGGEGAGTFELVVNQTMADFKKTPSNVSVTGGF